MATQIVITFETPGQAKAFMQWLDSQGEQSYFDFIKETELPGVNRFDYNYSHKQIIGTNED